MLNQTILVGRLVKNPELKELESGKKVCYITLAVARSYKNEEGIYDTDFVDVILWDTVAVTTTEYCKKGDLIGIKGRLETKIFETENEEKRKQLIIIAEKVTFLSNRKEEEKGE